MLLLQPMHIKTINSNPVLKALATLGITLSVLIAAIPTSYYYGKQQGYQEGYKDGLTDSSTQKLEANFPELTQHPLVVQQESNSTP